MLAIVVQWGSNPLHAVAIAHCVGNFVEMKECAIEGISTIGM